MRFRTCDYQTCDRDAERAIDITVHDAPDTPTTTHYYCKDHDVRADIDILQAVLGVDRLDEVKWKSRPMSHDEYELAGEQP